MRKKDLLLLLISGVILVIMWIVFNVIHNTISSTITDTLNQQIVPISATFDTATIKKLQQRTQILPSYTSASGSAFLTPTPTPVPVFITPIASQSAVASTSGGKQ